MPVSAKNKKNPTTQLVKWDLNNNIKKLETSNIQTTTSGTFSC